MPGPEVPKFIRDLITGLEAISAQLDEAKDRIRERRDKFNNEVLTRLRNYHFTFTDELANRLEDGVKNGKIRVTKAIEMVGAKGVFAALDELAKLKIDGKELDDGMLLSELNVSDDNPVPDPEICSAYGLMKDAIYELSQGKADGEKTTRKSAIATAIIAFKNAFVKYVAVQKYGLDPGDVPDGMNVDDLDAKNDEKRKEALDAAISDKLANALGINKNSNDLKLISIKEIPAKIDELKTVQKNSISKSLGSDERLGPQLDLLKKKLNDVQVVDDEIVERNAGDEVTATTNNLEAVYKEAMTPDTDEYVKGKIENAVNKVDVDNYLPADLAAGGLEVLIRNCVLENITNKEENLKKLVWDEIDDAKQQFVDIENYSNELKDEGNRLTDAYNAFSTKVADLAAEDKKLTDKIAGLIDKRMKNIDSDAAVAETLNEIKNVLVKGTGIPDFELGI